MLQILAASSKKQSGSLRFQEAVLASLTALSRSASSITQRNVDSAVDYVLEQVGMLHQRAILLWPVMDQTFLDVLYAFLPAPYENNLLHLDCLLMSVFYCLYMSIL